MGNIKKVEYKPGMKHFPYIAIFVLSLTVAYLLGSMQGQKEASLLKSSTTIKLMPTKSPMSTPTPSPSPYPSIQIYPTAIPTQVPRKCDYTRDQLKALFKITGISEEDTNTFFNAFTGDCFITNKNQINNQNNNINCTTRYILGTAYTSCN